jgi:ankyrin repeat protein
MTDRNQKDDEEELRFAAQCGDVKRIKLLLEKGTNVNAKNEYQETALMLTAELGDAKMIKLLLDNGAEVNAKDNSGYTALMFAAWQGHTEAVILLLENHANSTLKNNDGNTALDIARNNQSKSEEIINLLEEADKRSWYEKLWDDFPKMPWGHVPAGEQLHTPTVAIANKAAAIQ